ncbi:hypothetical protein SNEBB_001074 [Seison nebaliae]|nr:hypothetical protein SNEBB_001074 [Seison nebaliae]
MFSSFGSKSLFSSSGNSSNLFGGNSSSSNGMSMTNGTRGTHNVPYQVTSFSEPNARFANSTKIISITGMNQFENKCLEELRLEDYEIMKNKQNGTTTGNSAGTLFSSQSTPNAGTSMGSSLFGGKSNSLFSTSSSLSTTTGNKNIFGSTTTNTSGSLFGTQTTNKFPLGTSNSLSLSNTKTGSLFGTKQSTGGLFGSTGTSSMALTTSATTSSSSGLFGTTNSLFGNKTSTSTSAGGLFGGGSTSTGTSSIFGQPSTNQPASTSSSSLFGSKSVFGSNTNTGTNTSKSLFGNAFSNNATATAGTTGGASTTSSLFGMKTTTASSLFGGTNNANTTGTGLFNTSTTSTNNSMGNNVLGSTSLFNTSGNTVNTNNAIPDIVIQQLNQLNQEKVAQAQMMLLMKANPYGIIQDDSLSLNDSHSTSGATTSDKTNTASILYEAQKRRLSIFSKNLENKKSETKSVSSHSNKFNNSNDLLFQTLSNHKSSKDTKKTYLKMNEIYQANSSNNKISSAAANRVRKSNMFRKPLISNTSYNSLNIEAIEKSLTMMDESMDAVLKKRQNSFYNDQMANSPDNNLTNELGEISIKKFYKNVGERSQSLDNGNVVVREENESSITPVDNNEEEEEKSYNFVGKKISKGKNDILTEENFNHLQMMLRKDETENEKENFSQNKYVDIQLEENDSIICGLKNIRKEYSIIPDGKQLNRLTNKETLDCFVENFIIKHHTYGQVKFLGMVNLKDLDLDVIVKIDHRSVSLYTNQDLVRKPEVGEGLNRPAIVTLHNVWPLNKMTREPITDEQQLRNLFFSEKLKRSTEKIHGKFMEYIPSTGSWIFEVEHFSSYSFQDDMMEKVKEFTENGECSLEVRNVDELAKQLGNRKLKMFIEFYEVINSTPNELVEWLQEYSQELGINSNLLENILKMRELLLEENQYTLALATLDSDASFLEIAKQSENTSKTIRQIIEIIELKEVNHFFKQLIYYVYKGGESDEDMIQSTDDVGVLNCRFRQTFFMGRMNLSPNTFPMIFHPTQSLTFEENLFLWLSSYKLGTNDGTKFIENLIQTKSECCSNWKNDYFLLNFILDSKLRNEKINDLLCENIKSVDEYLLFYEENHQTLQLYVKENEKFQTHLANLFEKENLDCTQNYPDLEMKKNCRKIILQFRLLLSLGRRKEAEKTLFTYLASHQSREVLYYPMEFESLFNNLEIEHSAKKIYQDFIKLQLKINHMIETDSKDRKELGTILNECKSLRESMEMSPDCKYLLDDPKKKVSNDNIEEHKWPDSNSLTLKVYHATNTTPYCGMLKLKEKPYYDCHKCWKNETFNCDESITLKYHDSFFLENFEVLESLNGGGITDIFVGNSSSHFEYGRHKGSIISHLHYHINDDAKDRNLFRVYTRRRAPTVLQKIRLFRPNIRKCPFPINTIQIFFDCSLTNNVGRKGIERGIGFIRAYGFNSDTMIQLKTFDQYVDNLSYLTFPTKLLKNDIDSDIYIKTSDDVEVYGHSTVLRYHYIFGKLLGEFDETIFKSTKEEEEEEIENGYIDEEMKQFFQIGDVYDTEDESEEEFIERSATGYENELENDKIKLEEQFKYFNKTQKVMRLDNDTENKVFPEIEFQYKRNGLPDADSENDLEFMSCPHHIMMKNVIYPKRLISILRIFYISKITIDEETDTIGKFRHLIQSYGLSLQMGLDKLQTTILQHICTLLTEKNMEIYKQVLDEIQKDNLFDWSIIERIYWNQYYLSFSTVVDNWSKMENEKDTLTSEKIVEHLDNYLKLLV